MMKSNVKKYNGAKSQFPAVTIRVNDLYEWVRVVTAMEAASLRKRVYKGTKILAPKWLYRGQANSAWEIASGFERILLAKVPVSLQDKERYLRSIEKVGLHNFKQWADVTNSFVPRTSGEWLALMQHHGAPTRLIDFTEVPLIALAFALEDCTQLKCDFAVWAVLSNSFNCKHAMRTTIKAISDGNKKVELCDNMEFRVLADTYDEQLLGKILDNDNMQRISPCILKYNPIQMNKRQKLQRGLFLTCSHLSEKFMPLLHKWTDTCAADLNNPELEMHVDEVLKCDGRFVDPVANAHLIKYVFDKSLRKDARMLLRCCNIGERTRYGNNDTVAAETKEMMLETV